MFWVVGSSATKKIQQPSYRRENGILGSKKHGIWYIGYQNNGRPNYESFSWPEAPEIALERVSCVAPVDMSSGGGSLGPMQLSSISIKS